jgi:hypothetical protein
LGSTIAESNYAGKANYFDLLRKTSLTVPMYAYRLVLLVFGAFLNAYCR